jgi:hypothetical protein
MLPSEPNPNVCRNYDAGQHTSEATLCLQIANFGERTRTDVSPLTAETRARIPVAVPRLADNRLTSSG